MDVVVSLQKARLLAFLRRLGAYSVATENTDALMLIGVAVGLKLAANHPEVAARMFVELDPPPFDDMLIWVVEGSDHPDPDAPIN